MHLPTGPLPGGRVWRAGRSSVTTNAEDASAGGRKIKEMMLSQTDFKAKTADGKDWTEGTIYQRPAYDPRNKASIEAFNKCGRPRAPPPRKDASQRPDAGP